MQGFFKTIGRLRTRGLPLLSGICCLVGWLPGAAAAGLPQARTWGRAEAAHLLRRAGFGGTPQEVDQFAALGLSQAVDLLVDYERIPQTDAEYEPVRGVDRQAMRRRLRERGDDERREIRQRLDRLNRAQIEEMRAWWLRRMIVTPRPLEERMTLFWHGLFTSGQREVRNATMMWDQNALLRRHALGNFRALVTAISQDPAMLRYLDNANNRKQAPNENYARELLELFTLGAGNYSEQDIREAARALTGWTIRDGQFAEVRRMHDAGEKKFLGRTGDFDGHDIIRITLEEPAAARHLARKLLVYFVRDDPAPADVAALAAVVRASDFDLRETMRVLLKSEMFYAPEARFSRIKSPVDLVVGTFRVLELPPNDMYAAVRAIRGMGQDLFQPPNVKGWDGGRKWINTATVFARYNFASGLLTGTVARGGAQMMGPGPRGERLLRHRAEVRKHLDDYPGMHLPDVQVLPEGQTRFDPGAMMTAAHLSSADRAVNHFVDRILQMKVDPRQRKQLRSLVAGGGRFNADTVTSRRRVVSLVNALLTMPEYQVK
jgi:uncharacterized protein (DUF1800 family)